jgi:hypothetical protein
MIHRAQIAFTAKWLTRCVLTPARASSAGAHTHPGAEAPVRAGAGGSRPSLASHSLLGAPGGGCDAENGHGFSLSRAYTDKNYNLSSNDGMGAVLYKHGFSLSRAYTGTNYNLSSNDGMGAVLYKHDFSLSRAYTDKSYNLSSNDGMGAVLLTVKSGFILFNRIYQFSNNKHDYQRWGTWVTNLVDNPLSITP